MTRITMKYFQFPLAFLAVLPWRRLGLKWALGADGMRHFGDFPESTHRSNRNSESSGSRYSLARLAKSSLRLSASVVDPDNVCRDPTRRIGRVHYQDRRTRKELRKRLPTCRYAAADAIGALAGRQGLPPDRSDKPEDDNT